MWFDFEEQNLLFKENQQYHKLSIFDSELSIQVNNISFCFHTMLSNFI
jgi:hypothetical protein